MQQSDLNGILLMNKPQGFTSHDVVAKLRGILHTRRIGHGGTLDPMATGVLPVFVGGATKAADFAAAQDKEYVAGFTLGYCTDTQDVTGEMLQTSERYAAEYAVKQMVRRFIGPQQQVPPMYSAVKVNGQKLYDLARKGREVERPARDIIVHEMELLDFDENAQKGTLRGIHFQQSPMAQAKIVRVTRGAVMDVAVDLRKGSPTYLQWVSVELRAENKRQFYIPRGFGHGFVALTDDVNFCYKVDNLYSKECDRSIRFDDPAIGVEWGVSEPVLSDKDKNAPLLADSDCNFVYGKE